ncbi:MAG: hypothetical protein U0229_14530 [Anaeromyxobacter sp.]
MSEGQTLAASCRSITSLCRQAMKSEASETTTAVPAATRSRVGRHQGGRASGGAGGEGSSMPRL